MRTRWRIQTDLNAIGNVRYSLGHGMAIENAFVMLQK